MVKGTAQFTGGADGKEVEVTLVADQDVGSSGEKLTFSADHICIATGGYPTLPTGVKGADHGITSDGFFALEKLPKRMAVVGAGYIAVELAGVVNALGVETHLFIRGEKFLRNFDPMISETLTQRYEDAGVKIHRGFKGFEVVERLSGEDEEKRLKLTLQGGIELEVEELLWAVGRSPEVKDLHLERIGLERLPKGHIKVDEFQNTNIKGVYALGDVTGQAELTPGKFLYYISRQALIKI